MKENIGQSKQRKKVEWEDEKNLSNEGLLVNQTKTKFKK